ncbi:VOC family protein [Shimia abyssi]|uniref:VOC domain-containing protein n=1 Tax=Shimia abyssi TaxID=1662395 RepID=A0A2P8FBL7_9RHOB|nr:VOC family protein [Shimia abyssi]PSL19126.1 hypothetical protein CLV88_10769 [Shimia abyssi]
MTLGHFLWGDLSTYDIAAARADYSALFGWSFDGDPSYDFAQLRRAQVAAVFPMPSRLAKMDMPSFWMSYVHVADVDQTVAQARAHEGVIIEVEPQAFDHSARIALIRDPSGAGFTVYEGPDITPKIAGQGVVGARFHHVPDLSLISDFYADLFGWTFAKVSDNPWPTYDVLHPDGTRVAQVEEVPEKIRGKFRYWMPCFSVRSLEETRGLNSQQGGDHLHDLSETRAMLRDRQGAHFMVRAAEHERAETPPAAPSPTETPFAWKALLGLLCIWLAVFFDLQAFWGVLFLIWTWPALRSGRADFLEPIDRRARPMLYWLTIGTWLVLSVWLIMDSLV